MPVVFIPVPMRKLADGQTSVEMPGKTLHVLIENLEARYPGMREYLTEEGRLKPGMVAVVDGEASVEGMRTPLQQETEVHFLPAIAGGAGFSLHP